MVLGQQASISRREREEVTTRVFGRFQLATLGRSVGCEKKIQFARPVGQGKQEIGNSGISIHLK
jgi:hypothetical protein